MRIELREATSSDAAALAGLLGELGYPTVGVEVRARLAYWAEEPRSRVLVAEGPDRGLVGCVSVHALPSLTRTGRWARVESLVVAESARGTGVGRRLLDAAEQTAVEWGCDAMELASSRDRSGAHAFYRHLGYDDSCSRAARFWKDVTR